MIGCGCKICKAGLGEFTNRLILEGESPKSVIAELKKQGVTVTIKLLKRHLAAFEIDYPAEQFTSESSSNRLVRQPVTIELNDIDFSEYNFDINQPESVIAYLQKLNLKVYLNQIRITLQMQEDVIDGKAPNVPTEVLRNLAIAYEILNKSTGMNVRASCWFTLTFIPVLLFK
ncbi:MAG: hypothetical protein AAFR37_10225, partial [Cyanobacteria bacterium J06628_3]